MPNVQCWRGTASSWFLRFLWDSDHQEIYESYGIARDSQTKQWIQRIESIEISLFHCRIIVLFWSLAWPQSPAPKPQDISDQKHWPPVKKTRYCRVRHSCHPIFCLLTSWSTWIAKSTPNFSSWIYFSSLEEQKLKKKHHHVLPFWD